RFDRIIEFKIPDSESQIEIFKIHTRSMKLHDDVKFEYLVENKKLTGADIKAICTEAGMFAIREAIEKASEDGRELAEVLRDRDTCVRQEHLREAKEKVQERQGDKAHEKMYS
ncbi:MAG: hypothetical protein ACFFEE_06965, partial [Candidatus Thorarchaeota archaeon]